MCGGRLVILRKTSYFKHTAIIYIAVWKAFHIQEYKRPLFFKVSLNPRRTQKIPRIQKSSFLWD